MTTLKQLIQQDVITTMKAQDKAKLESLRYLSAQIKDAEIAQGRKELTNEQIVKLISGQIKKLEEAIVLYVKGGRQDLIAKNKAEIAVLKAYLPKQMPDEELEAEVAKVVAANKQINNPGALIGLAVKQLAGKADNSRIAQMVMKKLKVTV
jgi:hypothetical protein